MASRAALLSAALALGLAARPADAASYLFRVDCGDESFAALWEEPAPDPGRDYYRTATGTLNLHCVIADYDRRTDAGLARRLCRDPGRVINAFPIALIFAGLTRCG
ncbi:hypothetical protein [Methylocella sp.]|uniref:hypothetical protein n=1 Tax=Methylocella sp. TaxID=1978226 RepID=UPI0035B2D15E